MNRKQKNMFHLLNSRNKRRNRRGATAVEFAMVAPAFMIIIVICCEFSRMSIMRSSAQHACYETARFVMTEGATVADGIEHAENILGFLGDVDADITVNGSDGSLDDDGNTVGEIDFNARTIRVQIIIRLADNTLILPGRFFGNNRVGAQVTMRTERYNGYFDSTEN